MSWTCKVCRRKNSNSTGRWLEEDKLPRNKQKAEVDKVVMEEVAWSSRPHRKRCSQTCERKERNLWQSPDWRRRCSLTAKGFESAASRHVFAAGPPLEVEETKEVSQRATREVGPSPRDRD
eukprot:4307836-Amphidinium_carterae.2